ncbi:MAG: AAA family ATPase, partial [Myxococcaceae bacterium]
MSVTSGKGGVGKSHLAVNVAAVCAAGGKRVALIDADGGLANLDVLLGVQPQLHVGDLLDGASLDEVLFEARPNLALLPGAPGERRLAQLSDDDRRALQLAWTQVLERFDVVVVDVASGLSRDSLFFASAGEEPVLLVSDEPTSISDAAAVLQALQRDTSVSRVHVVVSAVRTTRSA